MGMRIATNVPSIRARKSLGQSNRELQKAMAQISSGSRITKAADDAAGLSISEGIIAGVRSYKQALRNTHDGISLIQVAEGGLGEISNMITRMRELAIQSSSDTVGDTERGFIQKEVDQIKSEIQRIASSTKFGERRLLNGEGDIYDFQVGIEGDSETNAISYDASQTDANLDNLGISGLDFSSKDSARSSLEDIDNAQLMVNGFRAGLGAIQNRLVSTTENNNAAIENLSAARARMRDADLAQSSAEMTKQAILQQATTSVLGQANASPKNALQLVG